MVFTAVQRTAFFENNDQMGIPHAMVMQLQDEGIMSPDNFVDFNKDTIKHILKIRLVKTSGLKM